MSKLIYLMAVCAALLALPAAAAAPEEGRHYLEVAFPQPVESGNRIEVREFFWYACPHCYTLEPVLGRWIAKKPKNVAFVRTPWTADSKPGALAQAQAYYAFEELGALGKLHGVFFDAIHMQQRRLNDEASIAEFVTAYGIDAAKFRAAFHSFGVRLNLDKAKRLNDAYGIDSVPTVLVDGKYITSPSMAGGEDEMLPVVEHLIKKAAQARKR